MTFSYEVHRVTDGALLVGTTKHISIDQAGKVVGLGEAFLPRLRAQEGD